MARVVFDTVIFVRSLLNRRSLWARLVFDFAGSYRLVVSPPVLTEVLEALRRPELTRRCSTLPGRNPAAVLGFLRSAEVVEVDLASFPPVCRDPKDDKFLATAKAGAANYVLSEDRDLLDLAVYEGIPIIDGATFITVLERNVSDL